MRLLLCTIVLLAAVRIGMQCSAEYRRAPLMLLDLANSLSILQSEICHRRAPLPEAFLRCAGAFEGLRPFYQLLYAGMRTDQPFLTVWQHAVAEIRPLSGDERHALLALGEQIGRYDAQTQETAFCICVDALKSRALQIRTASLANARLAAGCGLVCGLLLAIMCY